MPHRQCCRQDLVLAGNMYAQSEQMHVNIALHSECQHLCQPCSAEVQRANTARRARDRLVGYKQAWCLATKGIGGQVVRSAILSQRPLH